ncbi:MAG: RIP metalloprotease RseP [Clostridia bacterium]|nr:RIP metalloprotease RseP [Clostridia bacterium]
MGTIIYILVALLVLMVMITIHEFGHYITGKILKFKINEFSIGFGPAIFSRKCKNGELFSVRYIPLGGYCAFEGEEEASQDEMAFDKQAPWKRILVLISGGLFNIISGVIFSAILLCSIGYDVMTVQSTNIAVVTNTYNIKSDDLIYSIDYYDYKDGIDKTLICSEKKDDENQDYFMVTDGNTYLYSSYLAQFIYENLGYDGTQNYTYEIKKLSRVTPEEEDGDIYNFNGILYAKALKDDKISIERVINTDLQKGDIIYKVNGKRVGFNTDRQLTAMIKEASKEGVITLSVKRNGKMQEVQTMPHSYTITNGSDIENTQSIGISLGIYKYGFFEAIGRAIPFTFEICVAVIEIFFQLFTNVKMLSTVGGPVTTISTIAGLSQKSLSSILILLPLISANLGVFNLMPIPALDGSKVVFCVIEWIRKKPLNKDLENKIHMIGFFILMGLVVIADIYQVFFANIFKTLFG